MEHGLGLNYKQIAGYWKSYVHIQVNGGDALWFANKVARENMNRGEIPPLTGSQGHNRFWWTIDPQLVNELWSAVYPGMVDKVLSSATANLFRFSEDTLQIFCLLRLWIAQSGGPRLPAIPGERIQPASTLLFTALPSLAMMSTGCMTLVCQRFRETVRTTKPCRMFGSGIQRVPTTGDRPGTRSGMHTLTTPPTVVEFHGTVESRRW